MLMSPRELQDDGIRGYHLWVRIQRERAVRYREIEPVTEQERRQRDEGQVRPVHDYDCVRDWVRE